MEPNNQSHCPYCKSVMNVSPIEKNGRSFVHVECSNPNCFDPNGASRGTLTQARKGVNACNVDDAMKFLCEVIHSNAAGGFGNK